MKTEADLQPPTATDASAPAIPVSELSSELESLRATIEELQRRKTDAEKDRELFRELYNKASSHASEVTRENNTLSERVSIAEGQVREGLVMIRQTYESRVKALEDDVVRLRGLNEILNVRDAKMQGEDIRRRAGEETDLRAENQRLRAQMAQLRLDYHRMERLVEQLGAREPQDVEKEESQVQSDVPSGTSPAAANTTDIIAGNVQ